MKLLSTIALSAVVAIYGAAGFAQTPSTTPSSGATKPAAATPATKPTSEEKAAISKACSEQADAAPRVVHRLGRFAAASLAFRAELIPFLSVKIKGRCRFNDADACAVQTIDEDVRAMLVVDFRDLKPGGRHPVDMLQSIRVPAYCFLSGIPYAHPCPSAGSSRRHGRLRAPILPTLPPTRDRGLRSQSDEGSNAHQETREELHHRT
jgi:hypothetical protein